MKRTRLRRKSWIRRGKGIRKVSTRRRTELELDRHARLACLAAAGGRCERCGSEGALEWHHVVSRRLRALRWLLENSLCLCPSCHRWWHASPRRAALWFVERFGQDRLDRLHELRRKAGSCPQG